MGSSAASRADSTMQGTGRAQGIGVVEGVRRWSRGLASQKRTTGSRRAAVGGGVEITGRAHSRQGRGERGDGRAVRERRQMRYCSEGRRKRWRARVVARERFGA